MSSCDFVWKLYRNEIGNCAWTLSDQVYSALIDLMNSAYIVNTRFSSVRLTISQPNSTECSKNYEIALKKLNIN